MKLEVKHQSLKTSATEARSRGDNFAAATARLSVQKTLRKPRLQRLAALLRSGHADAAEEQLRQYLSGQPDDADAHFLFAHAANLHGRVLEAEEELGRCLALAPGHIAARFQRAKLLLQRHEYGLALLETDKLLAAEKSNPLFRQLRAHILWAIGDDDEARTISGQLAEENPQRAECWIAYGDALRGVGLEEECIVAYRRALACRPSFGSAWWSLANLKTYKFDDADIEVMNEILKRQDIAVEDRINVLFSLGKAWEDRSAFSESFSWYARGNASRRLAVNHDWSAIAARLAADEAVFTTAFMDSRKNAGSTAKGPIFVVGRPRSGSTLVEQILATHSAIEATAELPYIADLATRLEEAHAAVLSHVLARLDTKSFQAFGEEYLERTRIHRKTDRPFFIDKAPANYHQVGLIFLMLPNAKIIDVRRHPAANCFSMFKHNYSESNFRLAELGRVYRNYVALMAHFDSVAPGRIHRVFYEQLVTDPETEVRKLLHYLALPFEESCLRFHESKRTVRTPSSQQVRRPISSGAVDHWRNFEPWLGSLIESLGTVLSDYPDVPGSLK